jgi:hypothetical protein
MRQKRFAGATPQEPCADAIYHAAFKMTAIADLYGPERAVEWAQSLLDDPELLQAFARVDRARDGELSPRTRLPSAAA